MNNLGYNKQLFILAFDHRSSFAKLINVEGRPPSEDETQKIIELKQIIYGGFKNAIISGLPKENAAILIDEQFGNSILIDAKDNNYIIALPVEKSNQEIFEFEYGENFSEHIEKYSPTFIKVLIRYNVEDNQEKNSKQRENLKKINNFCKEKKYKLLIEVLIPPLETQLARVNNNKKDYDAQVRPNLTLEMIKQLQQANIEPDVWKLEGMEKGIDYQNVVKLAQSEGRNNVGIVVLGRGENQEKIEKWLKEAANVPGIIGFAIGRSIFMEPLTDFLHNKLNEEQVEKKIAENYLYFYNVFINSKSEYLNSNLI